jgi:hypothetical protein
MPKNQFQRPVPVPHTGNVPRHGKPQPPVAKGGKAVAKAPPATLPPLEALLAQPPAK